MSVFHDHFSADSQRYQASRPTYPPELFKDVAALCSRHELAWDVATGTGQAAVPLADHFTSVYASDGSASQITAAVAHPRVRYDHSVAAHSALADGSCDLILVAQAIHWFANDAFFNEVKRVAADEARLVVIGYGRLKIQADPVDAFVQDFYDHTIGAYWPKERALVERAYQDIDFPFTEQVAPQFAMRQDWTTEQLLQYIATWSAIQQYQNTRQLDPITLLRERLADKLETPDRLVVSWPLTIRVFRVHAPR